MLPDETSHQLPDLDPEETQEWLDSLDSVIAARGSGRARYLLLRLAETARQQGVQVSPMVSTDYINSIPSDQEPWFPGDEEMEREIRRIVRWNAAAMVTRANKHSPGIGGHLATYASAASLYEVGFNHFFRGKSDGRFGDQVFIQGHAAPGIYARAFVEGRLNETQLDHFRRETSGIGLPSYPHPRRMPSFWEYPTVSMGLGPLNAAYQANFSRYLRDQQLVDTTGTQVWCFVGDGEMDEPESVAAVAYAGRKRLGNLTFVVNCNLQRLDGPVRGNGKIIQELESLYRGAGWNVIKVIWGREWDPLLANDVDGRLLHKMNTTVDGQFQTYAAREGSYIREHFFGPDPELRALVKHLSDEDLQRLSRGGHDYRKLYAAYQAAYNDNSAPTVILAKTIKGWTLGPDFESRMSTHQMKKMNVEELKAFRDRLGLPVSDSELEDGEAPYLRPAAGSPEAEYIQSRRRALDGYVPERLVRRKSVVMPGIEAFRELFSGTKRNREVSTTGSLVRVMRNLMRDPNLGSQVVPIVSDEARTFGIDALFSEMKIYEPFGQTYEPVDADNLLSYRESQRGRIMEEGITEAGALATFTACATSYATWGQPMIPFYIFYSMFGFQRVGDLIWALGDQLGRGFLIGATAGRTTLQGEGLQHDDGQSPLLASAVPNCQVFDPAFAYEVALIVQHGIERMYGDDPVNEFYYLTVYNESVPMPKMPVDAAQGVIDGLYPYLLPPRQSEPEATILASGASMGDALSAREILMGEYGVSAGLWSATSYQRLRSDALAVERWNRLHPEQAPRIPRVTRLLNDSRGPIVAVTDYMKAVPDQVSRWAPRRFVSLGTDGFGLSDTRTALRRYFEVDAGHIVVAVLSALAQDGVVDPQLALHAVNRFGIDRETLPPEQRQ